MKKTIRDYDLNNKKVIIRCDFNVPIKNGVITDDNRIIQSLKTINYAIENNAKIILMSHLGRIKTEEDKKINTLRPVAKRLSQLLNKKVLFIDKTRGIELENAINEMASKDIVLIENTRFEDLDGKKESGNNLELGKYWASLGDIYINDAFGTSHRAHASNVGIATHLPNGIGFLVEKELETLESAINNPKTPLTVILGGSKVSDKIGVIKNLVNVADHILIGGGMAFTFLKAQNHEIGKSLFDEENIEFCKEILSEYSDKIILPLDSVCSKEISGSSLITLENINEMSNDSIGLDIGEKTIALFSKYLNKSKTIIWNGPVGYFEIDKFSTGTKKICEILSKIDATKIVGGGDTGAAITKFGYKDGVTYISTGGGASLELLEGKVLDGIKIINEK